MGRTSMLRIAAVVVGLLAVGALASGRPDGRLSDAAVPAPDHEGGGGVRTAECTATVVCTTGHHTWRASLSHGFLNTVGNGVARSVLVCDDPIGCGNFGGRELTCVWVQGSASCTGIGGFPPPGTGFQHYCYGVADRPLTCFVTHD